MTGRCDVVYHGERLRIMRADPVARISAALIIQLAMGKHHPDVSLSDGGVLTIRAVNRTVVYRIDRHDYDPATCTYRMEWPD